MQAKILSPKLRTIARRGMRMGTRWRGTRLQKFRQEFMVRWCDGLTRVVTVERYWAIHLLKKHFIANISRICWLSGWWGRETERRCHGSLPGFSQGQNGGANYWNKEGGRRRFKKQDRECSVFSTLNFKHLSERWLQKKKKKRETCLHWKYNLGNH